MIYTYIVVVELFVNKYMQKLMAILIPRPSLLFYILHSDNNNYIERLGWPGDKAIVTVLKCKKTTWEALAVVVY